MIAVVESVMVVRHGDSKRFVIYASCIPPPLAHSVSSLTITAPPKSIGFDNSLIICPSPGNSRSLTTGVPEGLRGPGDAGGGTLAAVVR